VAPNQQANIHISVEGGMRNHELGTQFFVHERIISAVKRVGFVSDRMPYIILRGRWCDNNVQNVHTPTEVKIGDMQNSFYQELERVCLIIFLSKMG
jgi:hypothetical protein